MNLNSRLHKLEINLSPPTEPKPDLSALTIEELRFLARFKKDKEQVASEELEQYELIIGKITWKGE